MVLKLHTFPHAYSINHYRRITDNYSDFLINISGYHLCGKDNSGFNGRPANYTNDSLPYIIHCCSGSGSTVLWAMGLIFHTAIGINHL